MDHWKVSGYISCKKEMANMELSDVGDVFCISVLCRVQKGKWFCLLLNVVLIFLVSAVGYLGNVWVKLLYIVLICVIGALIEMVTYFCLLFLLPSHTAAFHLFGSVISKMLSIILIILLNMKLGKYSRKRLPQKYIAVMLLIPIADIFIAYNIFFLDNETGSIRSTLSLTLLLFINCFVFEICQKLYESMEVEHENAIFVQQLELIKKHSEEQKEIYERQKEFRHNLKNYCIGLRVSIEHDEKEEALRMLDKIVVQGEPTGENFIDTGNDLIDTLVNYKYAVAKKYGIDVTADILVPDAISKVDCGDLSVILGNLIDNAIEAAKECERDKRIVISMGVTRGELVIDICNTYDKEPKTDRQGNFLTGKEDRGNHGFGIKSVQKAVKKYDGNVLFQTKEGIFEATVIINIV